MPQIRETQVVFQHSKILKNDSLSFKPSLESIQKPAVESASQQVEPRYDTNDMFEMEW